MEIMTYYILLKTIIFMNKDCLNEMLFTYEKFASLIKDELVLCPTDFPYLYNKFEPTQIILGNKRHWRVVEETLCYFFNK